MNYPVINTDRCQITIATTSDAYWLHALLNDKDVYKYIDGIRPFAETVRSTTQFIEDMLYAYNNGNGFLWKITNKEKPIGFICTFDFELVPSICYGMNIAFRNRGFMTEALTGVLHFQNSIYEKSYIIDVSKENLPSQCIYNKMVMLVKECQK